jgi:hypothetical protein
VLQIRQLETKGQLRLFIVRHLIDGL